MKELNTFRQFLTEGVIKENALAQKLRDEAKQPDSKVGAAIFNKYAKKIENADKADYKKIIKAMESELISKHPDTFSGEDDIPGSFLTEGEIKENYKNDYANSEEDYTDEMVVEKIKDIIKYHELDPQDVIDEIRIEFGVDAMD